jgi:hypothetical protein
MDHSFQILGAIEMLLLLKQEGIRHQRQPAGGLAMRRVWERYAFIVCEVGRIIRPFSRALHSR